MKRELTAILSCLACIIALWLVSGCGNAKPAAPPARPTTPTAAPGAADSRDGQVILKGASFYFYDKSVVPGGTQKPLVTIEADEFSVGTGEAASYSLKNVKATLHLLEGKDIIFEAAEGSFVENVKAYLRGGVRAQVNDMKIELEDIELSAPRTDAPGVAFSNHPVLLTGPGIEIEAEGIRLHPDEKKLELNMGSGYFEFGSIAP